MLSDHSRIDDLLARTLAQREVLSILVRLALPSEEERLLACKDAAEVFERTYAVEPVTARVRQSVDCALNELEQIFEIPERQQVI